jgi:hypothetical protein
MGKTQLSPKILSKLSNKLGLQESTIRQQISRLKQQNAKCTLNAVAQMYAMKHGLTVMQQLSADDKASLPHIEHTKERIKIQTVSKPKKQAEKKIVEFLTFESTDHFIVGHIKELNKAFTYGCYTACYILARKIIENLIIDILQKAYPQSEGLANKELYWDTTKKRYKDFSVILKNLFEKRHDFGTKNKAIERLYQLSKEFKDEANNKAHSWFHLVSKPKELEDLQLQDMLELIKKIEQ